MGNHTYQAGYLAPPLLRIMSSSYGFWLQLGLALVVLALLADLLWQAIKRVRRKPEEDENRTTQRHEGSQSLP